MNLLQIIISSLYATTGVIGIIGYIPTLKEVIIKHKPINIPSYLIWSFCNIIGLLYAIFVISNFLLGIVMGSNLFFCSLILILSISIRKKNN